MGVERARDTGEACGHFSVGLSQLPLEVDTEQRFKGRRKDSLAEGTARARALGDREEAGVAEQGARGGQQQEGRSWQHAPELVEVTEGPPRFFKATCRPQPLRKSYDS